MFTLYGRWEPAVGPADEELLAALDAGEDQEVFLGGKENRRAIVTALPETMIEARVKPGT